MRSTCATMAVLLAVATLPLQAQDWDAVEIKATKVAGNVYMLTGQGGNIGVSAGADGTLIVDDQFAPLAEKIRAALREIGAGEIQFVLNTHWHGDHTGGNVEFGSEATIVAHRRVRDRLSTRQEVLGRVSEPSPPVALPVITFDDSLSVHFNGEEIAVMHLPHGHTDGDSAIYFSGSNVLHLGDHFFNGLLPFIDLASGGNALGLAENVARVIEKMPADVKIIPGHGALAGIDDLKSYHRMLTECIARVRQGVEAGKSLAEIQEAGLPEPYETWASGFRTPEVFIGFLYESLWKR